MHDLSKNIVRCCLAPVWGMFPILWMYKTLLADMWLGPPILSGWTTADVAHVKHLDHQS